LYRPVVVVCVSQPIAVCRDRAIRLMNSVQGDEALALFTSTLRKSQGKKRAKRHPFGVTPAMIGEQPLLSDPSISLESTQFGRNDDDLTPYQRLLVSKVLQVYGWVQDKSCCMDTFLRP
jgi:hypothetical protein